MRKRLRDPRLIAVVVACIALFVAAALVPHPSVDQIRSWADSVGPTFPLLFFVAHALITVAPFPRTVFTLSAGVLFGAVTGIIVAVSATAVSAVLALLLVRAIGRDAFASRLTHPAVRAIDTRLARRGWLAVGSLRLIAPVPFSLVNYCCGVSSIRMAPYLLATIVGVIPGTIGIVVLGDALTGRTDPALLVLSGVCIAIGVAGLIVDARLSVDAPDAESKPTSSEA
ncbi:TVP38/TMEM64 family protein [Antrihabitans cavernicola]|uniref:TVP38/TMEM64 family membrane protein n=1 Tax=Antrihabitans cavernicola TaxID=2495913 RepID=A0A5A7SBV5_9NOCA|nr:TVP38/TMEM64 family protein [Spelaeibacter cavernicola]KAA0023598.1 TVP38/TMEM64 family protein [Spelaeibacter cavernicola]